MRALAEWLLVPLLVLPFVLAVGLSLWARDHQRALLAEFAERGPERVEAWLAEPDGPARWMQERFLREFGGDPQVPHESVTVRGDARSARLYLPEMAGTGASWAAAADYPAGLLPAALASGATRAAIEAGTPPVEVEGPDPVAAVLRDLLREPDREGLARARLPAAMKLYVMRQWREHEAPEPWFDAVEALLDVIRDVEPLLAADAPALPVGAHRAGRARVLATGGRAPLLVLSDTPRDWPQLRYVEAGDEDAPVTLTWSLADDFTPDPGALVWTGRIEQPIAGWFTFLSKHGPSWMDAPVVRRWAAPVAILLVALFLLPLGLLFSLRKRRRLEDARIRFINEIAHDLRTPLTSLRLHVEMLSEGRGKPEQRERYVRVLNREASRLSSLVGGLLDLSRLEGGRRSFDIEALDMAQVAEEAAIEFRALHPERTRDLTLDGGPAIGVTADRAALSRCLGNLLDNAGKFTDAGTPIRVSWEGSGERVRIRVEDDGPGIPPAERDRIFQRYARGERAQQDGVPGTGLGLSLVKELVQGMRGDVRLDAGEQGAAFELQLPGAKHA